MSFASPLFLFALAAISIPIIIHLFHFRRFKKVYFSNISFLERLTQETEKQARLKHLLVLLARILAITFLVLAFARPYIPVDDIEYGVGNNHISVYIDNSFSMEASSMYGNLLDHALQKAEEVAEMFHATDRFQLLTNDFEARHQRFVSKEDFLSMVEEVQLSPSVRSLSEVMERQKELLQHETDNSRSFAFVMSDFQKNIADFNQMPADTLPTWFFVPFQSQRADNLFIDSLWIENPVRMAGQAITLKVRLHNDSDMNIDNHPVRLIVGGRQRSIATVDMEPRSSAVTELAYTIDHNSWQQGKVEISNQPVIFDNQLYFSFGVSENIPVLAINDADENPFLNALFARDTTFIYRNMSASSIDYSLFSQQNMIIINELPVIGSGLALELKQFVEQGGSLLILPSINMDLASYNDFLGSVNVNTYARLDTVSTRVTSFNELHSIYTGVFDRIPENMDLPVVDKYYIINRPTRANDQYLMQLQNGNHFFVSVRAGQGEVFLSSVPARDSFSNFQRHAMFVPTLYNIALHSSTLNALYSVIGVDESLAMRDQALLSGELLRIKGEGIEVIPEYRNVSNRLQLFFHNQITQSGNYLLTKNGDTLRNVSFNYDRRESLLESYNLQEIEASLETIPVNAYMFEPDYASFEKQLELIREGKQLWKLFVLLALFCLLAEVLFLRFLK